ncbi:septal ring lytic transglycosylase RlpA family protein [Ramlibacter paludis]|uniref:septal ring lytic transglycosylase RlpA family protein n=1 Tax=Ramlibacter paludis TaxID=2908000 RepID=UPI003D287B45
MRRLPALLLALAAAWPLAGLADEAPEPVIGERGLASWYGARFHGKRTASGARFDMHALTAAHPSLPFGTRVLVRNLATGRTVEVRITDRGPHLRQRIIDLSHAAARAIGLGRGRGTAQVSLTVLDATSSDPSSAR